MTKKMLLLLALLLLCQPDGCSRQTPQNNTHRERALGADQRRILDGDCFRPVRTGAGESRRGGR